LPHGSGAGADYIAFINSFSMATVAVGLATDIAASGSDGWLPDKVIDGDDFVAFINAFSAGC
jgi:hypothetical protein